MRGGLVSLETFVTLSKPRMEEPVSDKREGSRPQTNSSYPSLEAQAVLRLLTEYDQQGLQGSLGQKTGMKIRTQLNQEQRGEL